MNDFNKYRKNEHLNTTIVFILLFSHSGRIGARSKGTYLQRVLPKSVPFPCERADQRSQIVPVSVHQLRPGKQCHGFTIEDFRQQMLNIYSIFNYITLVIMGFNVFFKKHRKLPFQSRKKQKNCNLNVNCN